MMDSRHPDDVDLLAYVDDELAGDRRRELAAHLGDCDACAETVAKLEAGRDALRAAPLLKLPPTMRERMTMTLDRFGPERRQPVPRTYVSPMRLVAILAPVAIVVALVVTIADLAGNGESGREAGGDAAVQAEPDASPEAGGATAPEAGGATAPEDAAGGAESAADPESGQRALASLVAEVAGPPGEVAAVLRRRGFEARVAGARRVVVSGASDAEVREALAGRRPGVVRVVTKP